MKKDFEEKRVLEGGGTKAGKEKSFNFSFN